MFGGQDRDAAWRGSTQPAVLVAIVSAMLAAHQALGLAALA